MLALVLGFSGIEHEHEHEHEKGGELFHKIASASICVQNRRTMDLRNSARARVLPSWVLGALCILAGALGACRSDWTPERIEPHSVSTSEGGGGAPSGFGICGSDMTTGTPACDTCLGKSCCAPLDTCAAQPVCLGCLVDVSSAPCATSASYRDVWTCEGAHCYAECRGVDHQVCDSQLAVAGSACAACLGDACCAAHEDCAVDLDCYECFTGAVTSDCADNARHSAVIGCRSSMCSTVCPEGR